MQDSEIEINPFYKIQKHRKNSKLLPFKRKREVVESQTDKHNH